MRLSTVRDEYPEMHPENRCADWFGFQNAVSQQHGSAVNLRDKLWSDSRPTTVVAKSRRGEKGRHRVVDLELAWGEPAVHRITADNDSTLKATFQFLNKSAC